MCWGSVGEVERFKKLLGVECLVYVDGMCVGAMDLCTEIAGGFKFFDRVLGGNLLFEFVKSSLYTNQKAVVNVNGDKDATLGIKLFPVYAVVREASVVSKRTEGLCELFLPEMSRLFETVEALAEYEDLV